MSMKKLSRANDTAQSSVIYINFFSLLFIVDTVHHSCGLNGYCYSQ